MVEFLPIVQLKSLESKDPSYGVPTSTLIHSFKKIVPSLCEKVCLKKRTSHCLREMCASRLYNENKKKDLIRSRTGHISDPHLRHVSFENGKFEDKIVYKQRCELPIFDCVFD